MKRITCWILLAIVLIMTGLQAEAKKKGPAAITFAETTYNFGTIAETKGVVSHQFEFTNTGDKPLVIVDATAECGCDLQSAGASRRFHQGRDRQDQRQAQEGPHIY